MLAYDEDHLLGRLANLTLELGKFPTHAERRMKSFSDSSFPNVGTFQRMDNKYDVLTKLLAYCSNQSKYADMMQILHDELAQTPDAGNAKDSATSIDASYGSVYLFRSGRYCKIGMTKDTVRRGSELRIQLPERMDLIHSIKTDDPSGMMHTGIDVLQTNV